MGVFYYVPTTYEPRNPGTPGILPITQERGALYAPQGIIYTLGAPGLSLLGETSQVTGSPFYFWH